jgi:extracellular factor (EF) 3-hydroxypalmitic acid methyl ester biosynthesis protein
MTTSGKTQSSSGGAPLSNIVIDEAATTDSAFHRRQAFLKLEELALSMAAMELAPPSDQTLAYNEANRALYALSALTRSLELLEVPAGDIIQSVRTIRELLSRSPFIRHLQTWPLGYQGDYSIVEYIMDAVNRSATGSWAWSLEETALQSGIVQQHRNKIRLQSDEVLRVLAQYGDEWNMLTLGCGGCRDLVPVLPLLGGFKGEIFLNDIDERALALAQSRLATVGSLQYQVLRCNALKAVRRLERTTTRFQFVLAGGLFDYLPDQVVIEILRVTFQVLLKEDGVCMFTNILDGNRFRPWMDYAVSWKLIERSRLHVLTLCGQAGIPEECVRVTMDNLNLAMIVRVQRPRI